MTQEELKTCLGQLLLDLRGNWADGYYDRMDYAEDLCNQIDDDTQDVSYRIYQERNNDSPDGRTFRGCSFYGYKSEEGNTEEVRTWLKYHLSYPENCELLDKDN